MFTVNRSKSGLPTFSESGGGYTNTGNATVVCDYAGNPLKPLFVPRGRANEEHAIFAVEPGMAIVTARHDRSGESVIVEIIQQIGDADSPDALVLKTQREYENGDGDLGWFKAAGDAALAKSKCYHCREAHYALAGQE